MKYLRTRSKNIYFLITFKLLWTNKQKLGTELAEVFVLICSFKTLTTALM